MFRRAYPLCRSTAFRLGHPDDRPPRGDGGCGGGQCRDHLEDESSPLTPVIDACGFIAWAYPSWRAPRLAAEVTASHERNARCQRIRQDIARHDTARVGLTRLPGRALFNARSETEAL